MIKRTIAICLITSLFIAGCWDSKELDEVVIVLGAAIDKKNDQFEITIQAPKTLSPVSQEKQANEYLVETAQGPTLFEGARNLTKSLARRNYWPHTQVVIISEEVAKEGIKHVIDFFTRDSQRRPSVYFAVTPEKGKSLLTLPSITETTSAIAMKDLIRQSSSSGYGIDIKLYRFIKDCNSIAKVSLLNKFQLAERLGETPEDEKKMAINLNGTGVFYNYKLIGYFNGYETRGAKWLKDDIKTAIISVNTQNTQQEDISLEITSSKTKLTPLITDQGYLMKVNLVVKGNIVEYTGEKKLLNTSLEELNKKFSNKIKGDIEHVFNKAKTDLRVDPFGFADKFADKYPYLLKVSAQEWNNIFADHVELDLQVEVKIKSSGVRLEI